MGGGGGWGCESGKKEPCCTVRTAMWWALLGALRTDFLEEELSSLQCKNEVGGW